MKLTSLPQVYRHVNRWREIITVLSRYELAGWLGRVGPNFLKDMLKDRAGESLARQPWETRVRLALAELGPTFIKLGQVLSTRPDLVGVDLAEELRHLQTDVPADPPETARQIVEEELERPIDEVFSEFEDAAMASASIGQVHRARLLTGEDVVVKVQHADIRQKIDVDLDILAGLAHLAESIEEFQNYRPRSIVAEFKRALGHELDFLRELKNMQRFSRDFEGSETLRIPRPYPEWCSRRVLVMERLEGIKLFEKDRLADCCVDTAELARRGADIYMEMIFTRGFYHADPHPGNVLVLEGGRFGLLDYGMVGRIDEEMHEDFSEMLIAVTDQDPERLTQMITRVGSAPAQLDRTALRLDVADYVAHYGSQSLDSFNLSGALNEMTEMIRRYRITLPPRIAMLIKVLVELEGTARLLSPKFNLIEVMEPYHRRLMWRRYSPSRQMRKWRRFYSEVEHLIRVLPREILELLDQIESGTFDVHLDHRGLEPSVNRLVLGMLSSALILGSALLLAHKVPPVINLSWIGITGLSAWGMMGMVLAFALGLRVWRAISKSGKLEERHRNQRR